MGEKHQSTHHEAKASIKVKFINKEGIEQG